MAVQDSGSREIDRRFEAIAPHGDQLVRYQKIAEEARSLAILIDALAPDSREKSLALTAVEEARMWTNAAIAHWEP